MDIEPIINSIKDFFITKYITNNFIYKNIKKHYNNINSEYKKYIIFVIILAIVSFVISLIFKTLIYLLYAGILAVVVYIGLKVYDFVK